MSKYERKEYQETQVMRTVSPQRQTYNSNQNLSKFDSNLDCLLEDLQNSVSRPGSSLDYHSGGRSKETSRIVTTDKNKSLNTISSIKSNPVTEYSSDDAYNYQSPDGRQHISGYKREKYMYKTTSEDVTPENIRAQNSINQLDTLLDDLQQVKQSSFLDSESFNTSGTDPKYGGSIKKRVVNRELHYGDTPTSQSRNRTLERDNSLQKEIEYINEGTYTNTRTTRPTSPVVNSRTSTLTKQTKASNIHEYPVEVIETVSPDIDPEVLAQLDPNLRPPGNTKVTTTIKTYTYEIPGSGDYPTNLTDTNEQKYVYSPNKSISTPSKSFVYNAIENKENTLYQENANYPLYQKPNPPGVLVKETITTRNYQPGYRIDKNPPSINETYIYNETTTKNVDNRFSPIPPPLPNQNTYIINGTETNMNKNDRPTPGKETYILKETHRTTVNDVVSPQNPHYPEDTYPKRNDKYNPGKETYIIKEVHNTTTTNDKPFSERGYPVYNPPDGRDPPNTYIIKETTNTTTNHSNGPYQNGRPSNEPQNKTIIYRHETHSTNNNYSPNNPKPFEVETFDPKNPPYDIKKHPNEPINIQYSYKSTSKTQNNYKGGYPPNEETETLLPKKFPTDDRTDGPPKKLDELMATIGNEPPTSPLNAGFIQHEHEIAQQKKVENLKQRSSELEDSQKKEPPPKSKNIAGPPVYYPPGEMFVKNEEGGEAWRSQGAYARGSGKYQYEAESKSKSKMSSGATVVPVCLPLCCGLPCTLL
ncbi:uncharacterized protein LOC130449462 isoform X1 [Diorhabda sublineata]|uniref:uncharacterized protein LOC130449462 isoform X1 n=1 Tax=Diorhabda sublineata TaxID=1163346 RepID=UPI0024E0F173|nr:uncharacterized protein LOC130449462 isoform X1 [Diorhabda sublineata]XP_056643268.1 uncharacterized protein LOC130449462 isoform X1 [Diorhabda sublineata]